MNFESYIIPIITGICLAVGFVLKNAVPGKIINRFIPLIMGVLGVFLNIWMSGWDLSPEILLSGLMSGLSSTGLHEAFIQLIKKGNGTGKTDDHPEGDKKQSEK